jgi:hypothetical protein
MYIPYDDRCDISALIGKTLIAVTGTETGSNMIKFVCSDGTEWGMSHSQDYCESVGVEDVIGDIADLQDAIVLDAREEISDVNPTDVPTPEYQDCFLWTFYIIQTNKGAVTIRWYGDSNGYYSVDVDFGQIKKAN